MNLIFAGYGLFGFFNGLPLNEYSTESFTYIFLIVGIVGIVNLFIFFFTYLFSRPEKVETNPKKSQLILIGLSLFSILNGLYNVLPTIFILLFAFKIKK